MMLVVMLKVTFFGSDDGDGRHGDNDGHDEDVGRVC